MYRLERFRLCNGLVFSQRDDHTCDYLTMAYTPDVNACHEEENSSILKISYWVDQYIKLGVLFPTSVLILEMIQIWTNQSGVSVDTSFVESVCRMHIKYPTTISYCI